MYFDSVLDRETILCFLLFHETRFPLRKTISCDRFPTKRAPCPICIWEACFSGVSMIWIEKPSPSSFLQIPQNFHYFLQVGSPLADKNWLTTLTVNLMFDLVMSGSSFFHQFSCTSQHPQESPDMVAISCSRPSESQYSCILVSHHLKASRVYTFFVTEECPSWTWLSQCLSKYFRDLRFCLKVLLQVLLQAVNLLHVISYDHNIIYIHN